MKRIIFGHLLWLERARCSEPYWWNLLNSGSRTRHYFSVIQHETADGLKALVVILGPWRLSIGRVKE